MASGQMWCQTSFYAIYKNKEVLTKKLKEYCEMRQNGEVTKIALLPHTIILPQSSSEATPRTSMQSLCWKLTWWQGQPTAPYGDGTWPHASAYLCTRDTLPGYKSEHMAVNNDSNRSIEYASSNISPPVQTHSDWRLHILVVLRQNGEGVGFWHHNDRARARGRVLHQGWYFVFSWVYDTSLQGSN